MMKKCIFILICSICTQITFAQSTGKAQSKKPKQFSIGVQASMTTTRNEGFRDPALDFSGGFYTRYQINKHFALSGQLNIFLTESRVELLPVQVEYHLAYGKKIRPYFGFGAGVSNRNVLVNSSESSKQHFIRETPVFAQFKYGMGFAAGSNKVLNASLFYRYGIDMDHTVGCSFGLGWNK